MPTVAKCVASVGSAPVLPHDCRAIRLARAPVPGNDGLALIGDADRGDGVPADFGDHVVQRCLDDGPDLLGVMLDPAWLRIQLRELTVRRGRLMSVDEDRSAANARGAGVDRDHTAPRRIVHFRRFFVGRWGRCEGPVLVRLVGAGRAFEPATAAEAAAAATASRWARAWRID